MSDLNPQGPQMADESMVRTLAAQAEAIWPQESRLFDRYALPDDACILDAGCGTGEIASRLAQRYARGSVRGIDIIDDHLQLARELHAALGPRLAFEHRSVYDLGLPDAAFDLVVCRHVLHSIPYPDRVLAELARVTRPGGWLHVIAEDYGMLHVENSGDLELDEFWHDVPVAFGRSTGTDMHVGRHAYGLMTALGLEELAVDYVIVDPLRVPRETFVRILQAWRDGFVEAIGQHTPVPAARAAAAFEQSLESLRDRRRYAVWMVPVIGARVPGVR
jgi:SAM-dependent methyltransferase